MISVLLLTLMSQTPGNYIDRGEFPSTTTKTSTSSTHRRTKPTAIETATKLCDQKASISVEDGLELFRQHGRGDQLFILEEWRVCSDPKKRDHVILLRTMRYEARERKVEAAAAREVIRRHETLIDRQQSRKLTYLEKRKSPVGAWALSFFFGLGIGNFYADAPGYATLMLLGQVISGGGAIIAANSNSNPIAYAVVNRAFWVADWAGAIGNASSHNRSLRRRIFTSSPNIAGELIVWSPVFEF